MGSLRGVVITSPFALPETIRKEAREGLRCPALMPGVQERMAHAVGKHPAGSYYGAVAESLEGVPDDARYLKVAGDADIGRLGEMSELEALLLFKPSKSALSVLRRLKNLRFLGVGSPRQETIDALADLRSLEVVQIGLGRQVTSLRPLAALEDLKSLSISETRPVSSLEDLGPLRSLRCLEVNGEMYRDLKLPTLDPLRHLVSLRSLVLQNVSVGDRSLAPISELRLSFLFVPNKFSTEEFARLAAALPDAQFVAFTGFFTGDPDHPDRALAGNCPRCDGGMVTTTGRPTKRLCPACDRDKVEKHRARWRALIQASR
jgi:hypothetical protein